VQTVKLRNAESRSTPAVLISRVSLEIRSGIVGGRVRNCDKNDNNRKPIGQHKMNKRNALRDLVTSGGLSATRGWEGCGTGVPIDPVPLPGQAQVCARLIRVANIYLTFT
jgi:hypothetical protein